MAQYYYSEKGYLKLKEEIARLDKLVKFDIAKEIATAAAHGDLKENAEYRAAKEKQMHYAKRLQELGARFTGANVVRREELMPAEAVTFGKKVRIRDVNTGAERQCTILGEGETDRSKGVIAYTSPLARALIGNKKGDIVDAQLPVGEKTFEILDVEFYEEFLE
jgi:transcription elongation factor GreA